MAQQHVCALCRSHATVEHHSSYMGHPIVKSVSWITRGTHWHSGEIDADTLKGIKVRIRVQEGMAS